MHLQKVSTYAQSASADISRYLLSILLFDFPRVKGSFYRLLDKLDKFGFYRSIIIYTTCYVYLFTTQSQLLTILNKETLEKNTVGKGENTGNQHFLLFSQCFSILSKSEIFILATFNLSYANALKLVTSKI